MSLQTLSLVVVNAGTSEPSTTKLLAEKLVKSTFKQFEVQTTGDGVGQVHGEGSTLKINTIDLRPMAGDIMQAFTTQFISPALQDAIVLLRDADALIAATPVYKAGASGLFTSFFQILDNDLLIGVPVVLAATAGSPRHALVVDDQLRGLFAYLRALPVPTSIVASPDDWNSNDFGKRADRAATELVALMLGGFRDAVRGNAWSAYQHSLGSAGATETDIDLDTELMRLAAGG